MPDKPVLGTRGRRSRLITNNRDDGESETAFLAKVLWQKRALIFTAVFNVIVSMVLAVRSVWIIHCVAWWR